jgi:protein SCO1
VTRGRPDRRRPARRGSKGGQARGLAGFAFAGVLLALLLLGGAGALWLGGEVQNRVGGPFTLEDGRGQIVTDRDFRGKYMLVYFGYTHCADVCPTTLSAIAAALSLLGPKADRVVPIFVTVDPARDTPSVMRRYTARFSRQLVGLTGTAAEIARVAAQYHVYYAKHFIGPGSGDYSMDHSSAVYLMGPTGRFVAPVFVDAPPPELAASLARLVS